MDTVGPKIRVLIVPDTMFWVTGTMARAMLDHCAAIEGEICSGPIVKKIMNRYPDWFDQFDLVHVLCPYSSSFIIPFFKGKKPVVTTIHHVVDWAKVRHNIDGDIVMTVAKEWEVYLQGKGVRSDKQMLVYNGVDSSKFTPVTVRDRAHIRSELGFAPETFVIGFFAKRQLSKFDRKGIDIFETAIVKLAGRQSNIGLLLIGPGWSELVKNLSSRGVRTSWKRYVEDHSQLQRMYSALDCYWVTSNIEGGPVTLLEAMSCGVPCISTPVGLALEIVENQKTGLSIEKHDIEDLISKTKLLIDERSLREQLGEAARNEIVRRFDCRLVYQDLDKLYEKAESNFRKSNFWGRQSPAIGSDSTRFRSWLLMEEQLNWISILMTLGETGRAFRFGIISLFKSPSFEVLAMLARLTYYKLKKGLVGMKIAMRLLSAE